MFWCAGVENLDICAASALLLFPLSFIVCVSSYILIMVKSTSLSLNLTASTYQCLVQTRSRPGPNLVREMEAGFLSCNGDVIHPRSGVVLTICCCHLFVTYLGSHRPMNPGPTRPHRAHRLQLSSVFGDKHKTHPSSCTAVVLLLMLLDVNADSDVAVLFYLN